MTAGAPAREAGEQTKTGPAVRPLAVSYVVSYVGDGIFYVVAALYFTRIVGLDPIHYGAALTASWTVAMALSVPAGHLADRFEARTVTVAMLCTSGLALGVYLLRPNLIVFCVVACFLATATEGANSARSALIARIFPADQVTRVRAVLVSCSNGGLAVGAAIGAGVLAVDTAPAYMVAFAVDGLSFFAAGLLLLRVPRPARAAASGRDEAEDPGGNSPFRVFRDRGYVVVGALNVLLVLHVPLIDVALPLWVVRETEAPAWMIGAVFVVNTVLVVLFQYRVAKGIRSIDDGLRRLRVSGVLLFAGMAFYAVSGMPSSPLGAALALLVAIVVLTVGEMQQTASMTEISFRLVPDQKYGQYQGFFGMGSTLSEAVAPLALTWLVLYQGTLGWLVLGGVILVASFVMRAGVALARRDPLVRENAR